MIGLVNIDAELLEQALFANYKQTEVVLERNSLPFFKLVKSLKTLLTVSYVRTIPGTGILSEDHQKSTNLYKDIFSIFDPFVEQFNESMAYSNGKCYYSYAAPNYLNRLINKITTLSDADFIEWCENYYFTNLIHGSFFDPALPNYFTPGFESWLRDFYLDAKRNLIKKIPIKDTRRGQLSLKTFLSYNGVEFSKLTPLAYIEFNLYNLLM